MVFFTLPKYFRDSSKNTNSNFNNQHELPKFKRRMQINNFNDQKANGVKSKKVPKLKKEGEERCRKIITFE